MRLDVLVPTYKRAELLEKALRSLLQAPVPAGLQVRVVVLDNNSHDGTGRLVDELRPRFGERLQYAVVQEQGKSHALNQGIATSDAELIGIIDDDERIHEHWYTRVFSAFQDPSLDFIGGPCVPDWSHEPPAWLPRDYPAVVGRYDGGPVVLEFGPGFPGILTGGNCVIRRCVLGRAGPYAIGLGRTGRGLISGEDREMYRQLLAVGARGLYLPDLIIYHHVPAERLTKRYHRRRIFWEGISTSVFQRWHPPSVPCVLGIERWVYRKALVGLLSRARSLLWTDREPGVSFSGELDFLYLLGLLYGRHIYGEPK